MSTNTNARRLNQRSVAAIFGHQEREASGVALWLGRLPSALADLAFFVLGMAAAGVAELLDDELLRHGALVLVGDVVVALAGLAGQFDQVTHGVAPWAKGQRTARKVRAV